ncbi:hypothetical protein [Bacillus infantis]|uniref:hypothetical protein n=1 Tax=Bacillus infantis TaxID=324767 RepID=UPI003CEE73B4
MNKKEKISKKDIIYIFIILQLIIFLIALTVIFISVKVTDPSTLINQISLVSGIASIILAFVAIIYAFFQSYSSGKQNKSLEDLVSKISNKVEEIGPLKQEVLDSKETIKRFVLNLEGSLSQSFQQIDSQIKQNDIELASNMGEIYKSFFKSYLQNVIQEVSNSDEIVGPKHNKFQDFYVILTTKSWQGNKDLNDEIPLEYIDLFRKQTSIWTIASNINVFADYTGLSFTLSINEKNKWTAQEVKEVIENHNREDLNVFTVAELIY